MSLAKLRNILRISSQTGKFFEVSKNLNFINKSIYSVRTLCSKPTHIVQMRGLENDTQEVEVIEYFKPLGITPKAVHLKCDGAGRVSGVCEVEFATHAEAVVAMRKKNAFLGNRFIRLTLRSSEVVGDQQKSDNVTENLKSSSKNTVGDLNIATNIEASFPMAHVVKMKNAPRRITDLGIYEFFWPIGVSPVSVKAVYSESGARTGEFEVHFLTSQDAFRAMAKNNSYLRNKFVELSLQQ